MFIKPSSSGRSAEYSKKVRIVIRSWSSGSVTVGSNAVANRSTRGWNAQSTVAYHSASFEPKRPLSALWLTPNSRLRVRSATPSYPWVAKAFNAALRMSSSDAGDSSLRGRPLGLRRDGALMVSNLNPRVALTAHPYGYDTNEYDTCQIFIWRLPVAADP